MPDHPPELGSDVVVERCALSGQRYLKLLPGNVLHRMAEGARRISGAGLEVLFRSEWRARLTVAWLITFDRRQVHRERFGWLLLDSETTFAGQGY